MEETRPSLRKTLVELLKFYMGPNSPQRKEYIMTNLTVSKYE